MRSKHVLVPHAPVWPGTARGCALSVSKGCLTPHLYFGHTQLLAGYHKWSSGTIKNLLVWNGQSVSLFAKLSPQANSLRYLFSEQFSMRRVAPRRMKSGTQI